jgi:hypothetical protein
MLLVNFFAGPGAGKSTTSAYVFAKLKMAGVRAELVGEQAKDYVYDKSLDKLDNQILLLGKQFQRTKRLAEGNVEVAISDSPFALSIMYGRDRAYGKELTALVRKLESLYPDTLNIFVKRVKPYQKFGRLQTAEKAAGLDQEALSLVTTLHYTVTGNQAGADDAVDYIMANTGKGPYAANN